MFLSANYVNRFDLDGTAYRVIPMVERAGRPDPAALLDLQLRTPDGDLVPLSAVASLSQAVAPRELSKFETIQIAKNYIKALNQMLREEEEARKKELEEMSEEERLEMEEEEEQARKKESKKEKKKDKKEKKDKKKKKD